MLIHVLSFSYLIKLYPDNSLYSNYTFTHNTIYITHCHQTLLYVNTYRKENLYFQIHISFCEVSIVDPHAIFH